MRFKFPRETLKYSSSSSLKRFFITSTLATASVLQPFIDVSEGKMFTVDPYTIKVGGLMVYGGKLYGTAYSYYDADGNQVLSHYRSALNLSVKGDVQGMYEVGSLGAGFVSGYMTAIPSAWQSAFGGPVLTGQCCLAIISRTSYGPAVSVFDPNDLGVTHPVPDIPLVYYPSNHPLADWSATSPYFNGSTEIKGMVFPQNTRSVLFFGRHGIGTFCYGPGTSDPTLAGKPAPGGIDSYCYDPEDSSKGTHAYPYVSQVWGYDAAALLQVKNGQVQPWSVQPYAVWSLHVPIAGAFRIGGATYDPQTGRIFVSQECADTDCLPVIHVFQAP